MPEPVSKTMTAVAVDALARRRPARLSREPDSGAAEESRLKAVCEDMEALFVHHMLSEMRKTVAKSGLIDGGRSEEIYTSLMDAELAKEMAHSGGLGLSAVLEEQLRGAALSPQRGARKR
jgi:flagellar protein FlgJ